MSNTMRELSWAFPMTVQLRNILQRYRLREKTYARNILLDTPLLIALAKRWDQDCCSFHLPIDEITVTLLDLYMIWGISIMIILVHEREISYDNIQGQDYLQLTEVKDHYQDHQSIRLTQGYQFVGVGQHLRVHVVSIITSYLCPNQSGLEFPLGLTCIFCEICMRGRQFIWGSLVLAQLYHDLYSFINVDKINMMISHASLLQVWVYEHIVMVRSLVLERIQINMIYAILVCWISHLGGYRSPQMVETRRRQVDNLLEGDLVWVCYMDYAWDEDAYQLAWMKNSQFFQMR